MLTWWNKLIEDNEIKILECEWCYESAVLYDTGMCNVCEKCLKETEFEDSEALSNSERNI